MKRILIFAGTRPEVIKMAPVIRALKNMPDTFEVRICSTGQHRELISTAFADFDVVPDIQLNVMSANQSLSQLSGRLFGAIGDLVQNEMPDAVLVQGDTTTVMIAALCAFYRNVPVGHVEAGLRSHDINAPFPEEMNRRIATLASTWFFAPTERAGANLLAEGIPAASIYVTGNTVVDALLQTVSGISKTPPVLPDSIERLVVAGQRIVVVTGHRRENFGRGLENICDALVRLARAHPDVAFVYPLHLNPNVVGPVTDRLSGIENIYLEKPLPYSAFIRLMDLSLLILTDSGGAQEEGPSLRKPVLVMRDVTERPEGVEAGTSILVGTDAERIFTEVHRLLTDSSLYATMTSAGNPFGDGTAGKNIAMILCRLLAPNDSANRDACLDNVAS